MGFSEAVQWWEEWQLRVLVLGSLFLQYFLYFAAPLRKRCIPSWFRFIIWLAYLGSDAVTIYALAALFNRHKKQESSSTHADGVSLEALWAPILLVYLGGVDGITAYNIEDNELWRRYVLTSVSQAAVAIYVFRSSWKGDKRLLQAAILVFFAGILKCFAKPIALKSASINSLMSISSSNDDTAGVAADDARGWKYLAVEVLKRVFPDIFIHDELYYPFVDMAASNKFIKGCEHEDLRTTLSLSFDRLYTKEQLSSPTIKLLLHMIFSKRRLTRRRLFGYVMRGVVTPMIFTALGLFHSTHKEAYNPVDVKVTYILLSFTASLEYIGMLLRYVDRIISNGNIVAGCMPRVVSRWPDHIAQYSLIGYMASKKRHRILTSITAFLGCEDYLDPLWCMKPYKASNDITYCVRHYIETWKGGHNSEAAVNGAIKFTDSRGHWTLSEQGCGGSKIMREMLRRPFDESVLLWHLTTEFCYFNRVEDTKGDATQNSRAMSNYMVYLLFVNPEMLMTGARPSLFRDEYERLKVLQLDDGEPTPEKSALSEEELAKKISQKLKDGKQDEEGITDAAWVLSKELLDLGKDHSWKMWNAIQGVWVEMLCFSASRCRGYLHAKSLGKGGEFLSYIWLLLSRMGMETLAGKMQRAPELPKQEDDSASGGGDEFTDITSTTPAEAIISDENEQAEVQVEEGTNDRAACTTPATTDIGDEKRNEDGDSHCATSAAPAAPVIGDENV